jgi:SNF2-related domain
MNPNDGAMIGILADDMGLGKTIQTLAFVQELITRGTCGRFLIIWYMEFIYPIAYQRWTVCAKKSFGLVGKLENRGWTLVDGSYLEHVHSTGYIRCNHRSPSANTFIWHGKNFPRQLGEIALCLTTYGTIFLIRVRNRSSGQYLGTIRNNAEMANMYHWNYVIL